MAVVADVVSMATVSDDVSTATDVMTTVVGDDDVTFDVTCGTVDVWSEVDQVLEVEVIQASSWSSSDKRAVSPSGQQPYSEWTHDATSPDDA